MKVSATISELKRIAAENGGLLKPETVVEEARPISSPLHNRFTWDNTKAAHEYRLWEARHLIRVVVEQISGTEGKHEVFVSLTQDRKETGYRVVVDVLSDEYLREQMLNDALGELNLFRQKYIRLKELVSIFTAIGKVSKMKKRR
jgi:hypothetical protein